MAKSMKPGGGGRFAKLKGQLAHKGVNNPGAVAASIGRAKYGKEKFQSMAAKGKKRAEHKGGKMAGSKRDHDGAGMGHHNSNMPDGHKAVHGMHDGVKEHIHHAGNLNFHERHSTHEHTHSEHHHKMKHG